MRAVILLCVAASADACTMYGVGKFASADGTTMVSHSDDGAGNSDSRLSYVPPADHAKNSKRPVYPSIEEFPKFTGDALGKSYKPKEGMAPTKPIGEIPQVPHTYGYYVDSYAMQNECGLMFGESTASAVFRADAIGVPSGTALMSIDELSHIAAERVCTAAEAVQVMGDLAMEHGFYGPDGGAGEMLVVGDPQEVWMFHILSDPTAKSAIWIAQRVPDDEVAVAANHFMIREIDLDDSKKFLGGPKEMGGIAQAHGLWDGKGKLDFTAAFSLGEYGNKYPPPCPRPRKSAWTLSPPLSTLTQGTTRVVACGTATGALHPPWFFPPSTSPHSRGAASRSRSRIRSRSSQT